MSIHKFNRRRLDELKELLEIEYDKLHEFEKEFDFADGASQKISIRQRIKRELLPRLQQHEGEYAEILVAGVRTDDIPNEEAENIVYELVEAIPEAKMKRKELPEQIVGLLQEIKDNLIAPEKSAAAKLKVVLPIIPSIISYELELDTESIITRIWRRAQELFERLVNDHPR